MSLREIVVHFDTSTAGLERLTLAEAVAENHDARVVAIGNEDDIASASRRWEGNRVNEWRTLESPKDFALHARYADLAVLGQPEETGHNYVTDCVMNAARPFLIIPRVGHFRETGRRIMIAWNSNREVTRAVFDSMALLTKAQKVSVLTLGDKDRGANPGADISLTLARHGVNVEVVHAVTGGIDIGNVLLSQAADLGADMIVMGAFSRHPLREWAMGGASHHILRHMTVPILMSH